MPRICFLHALPAAYAGSVAAGDFGQLGEPEATLELGTEWDAIHALLDAAGPGAEFLAQGLRLHPAQAFPLLCRSDSVQAFAGQLQAGGIDTLVASAEPGRPNREGIPPGNGHAGRQAAIAAGLRALADFVRQCARQQQCIVIAIEDY